ncbi:MAG: RsmB/NOP family class I SAM-dependent RNA methyltransferase [Microbacteriaceae bacterium]
MTRNARDVAVSVVAEVRVNDAYANIALPKAITAAKLQSRDAADATTLTYGTARWQGFIDAVLRQCVDRPLTELDGDVLDVLRVGAFEITVGDEPAHIVNEWVEVAKRRVRRASGLVNATLRKVSRRTADEWREHFAETLTGDALIEATTSHPAWIVRSFASVLNPTEVDELIEADNAPAHPTLIALPGLASVPPAGTTGQLSPYAYPAPPGPISDITGIHDGSVRVQDEGSQVAAILLGAVAPIVIGEEWLDLCAGPGGKTALLAALQRPHNGFLVANEPHDHRAELVRQAVRPFRDHVRVISKDGRIVGRDNPGRFDRVLVDAPCSGLGALRRRPESRWRKREEDLDVLTMLQIELLTAAVRATKPGGYIAYVTCSPDARETVEVVQTVLDEQPFVTVIKTVDVLASITPNGHAVGRGTAVQLWPHRHGTDAMFIQLLQRTR